MNSGYDELTARVLEVTLALTQAGRRISLDEIASKAQVSKNLVKSALRENLGQSVDDPLILSRALRLQLALKAARDGDLKEIAKPLTWQEFEGFAEKCLTSAGFQTEANVTLKADGRRWQVDLVGSKGQMLLCFDCKHWKPPYYPSKFVLSAEHQRKVTRYLAIRQSAIIKETTEIFALPILLTVHEPPESLSQGVLLVSIGRLPDFLDKVTPLLPNLPFISASEARMESSIK